MSDETTQDEENTVSESAQVLPAPAQKPTNDSEKRALIEADEAVRSKTKGVDWDAYPRKYLN
jgi:hypothetical protein